MEENKVVIIGSGIAGMTEAIYLKKRWPRTNNNRK